MTSVSPPHSRFTMYLHQINKQEVSVFAMPEVLIDCLIQMLFPNMSYSFCSEALHRRIDLASAASPHKEYTVCFFYLGYKMICDRALPPCKKL